MHISEGVLSAPVIAAGWGFALAGLGGGLKKTAAEKLTETALVSAALFLVSLVHVPLGPSSIHLTMLGLAGILLGWSALPALFVALLLQAILLQFGGLLSLGVNTTVMGTAALSSYALWRILDSLNNRDFLPHQAQKIPKRDRLPGNRFGFVAAFCCGFIAVITGSALVTLSLFLSARDLSSTAALIFAANLPLALVEGFVTAFCVLALKRLLPQYVPGQAGI
jgi:cobalt/nickel transport system permease protein